MYQFIARHPRLANTIGVLLATGAAFAAALAAGDARAGAFPEAGGCTVYEENDQYPLMQCDKGPAIRIVLSALRELDPALSVDGYFGVRTEAAVLQFQQAIGQPVTGLVDFETWFYLTLEHPERPDLAGFDRVCRRGVRAAW